VTQSKKITAHVVLFQLEKQKKIVHFVARDTDMLWLFVHLNCSVTGFVNI